MPKLPVIYSAGKQKVVKSVKPKKKTVARHQPHSPTTLLPTTTTTTTVRMPAQSASAPWTIRACQSARVLAITTLRYNPSTVQENRAYLMRRLGLLEAWLGLRMTSFGEYIDTPRQALVTSRRNS